MNHSEHSKQFLIGTIFYDEDDLSYFKFIDDSLFDEFDLIEEDLNIDFYSNPKKKRGYIRIAVYDKDTGDIPHFHIISNDGEHGAIKIDVAEYFNHNSHLTLTLNAKTIRKLDEFLSSNYDDIHTHWHLIQKRWNDLYGIPKGRQQKSVAISQPNYNNLPTKQ